MHNRFDPVPFYGECRSALAGFFDTRDESIGLPFLDKPALIAAFPRHFMTRTLQDALRLQDVEYATTSGTTSDRLQVIRPQGCLLYTSPSPRD